MSTVTQMGQQNVAHGFEVQRSREPCLYCPPGKATRASHHISRDLTVSQVGQLVEMDLIGPTPELSIGGNRFALLCQDKFSKYSHIYFLKTKDQVLLAI